MESKGMKKKKSGRNRPHGILGEVAPGAPRGAIVTLDQPLFGGVRLLPPTLKFAPDVNYDMGL